MSSSLSGRVGSDGFCLLAAALLSLKRNHRVCALHRTTLCPAQLASGVQAKVSLCRKRTEKRMVPNLHQSSLTIRICNGFEEKH